MKKTEPHFLVRLIISLSIDASIYYVSKKPSPVPDKKER